MVNFKGGIKFLRREVNCRLFERGLLVLCLARSGHDLLRAANVRLKKGFGHRQPARTV